ncbi:MAG: hypothetical protein ACYTKD_19780 [Planctomycetota bacterium]|jgi:hypothetical protein
MEFRPGFRLSVLDAAALGAGACLFIVAIVLTWRVAFAVVFVVGHFFLFCNVFRIARILELMWVAVFVALEGGRLSTGTPVISTVIWISLALTVCVVLVELRRPSYHGVLWKTVNPGLREWFEMHLARGEVSDTSDGPDHPS